MARQRKKRDMRGFASMDADVQREIASKGGINVPAKKRGFYKDRKLAQEAGSIGGRNVAPEKRAFARDPELASQAGRLSVLARERKNTARSRRFEGK
jgi:general stress protein YciG